MGLFKRAAKIVESNLAEHREKQWDPEQELQAAYQKMITEVGEVKRLLGEVAYAHKHAQDEIGALLERLEKEEQDAKGALARGDEERAREILVKRRKSSEKLVELRSREAALRKKLEKLQDAEEDLRDQVRAFRDKRDQADARLAAANAQCALQKAAEAISHDGDKALENMEDAARMAEARVELTETIDEQLERLIRESKKE